MGDAPRGEQGEETQPLFRGGPGAIPTTRVSYEDTRDLTETPGWAIPKGKGSLGVPRGRELYHKDCLGGSKPPGQSRVWLVPGRQKGDSAQGVLA